MILENKLQYYCTHHYLATERKQYIQDNIEKPNNIIINWIEKYKPTDSLIVNHRQIVNTHSANGQYLNSAELSCYYKHYLAIKCIHESGIDGMIFEDDIEKPQFIFNTTISSLHSLMLDRGCDILFIGSFGNYDLSYDQPTILINENTKSRCAHCYIVRCNIANKLADYLFEPFMPLDWQLSYAIKDLGLVSGWSYPHIYQRTEKQLIKSLLRQK